MTTRKIPLGPEVRLSLPSLGAFHAGNSCGKSWGKCLGTESSEVSGPTRARRKDGHGTPARAFFCRRGGESSYTSDALLVSHLPQKHATRDSSFPRQEYLFTQFTLTSSLPLPSCRNTPGLPAFLPHYRLFQGPLSRHVTSSPVTKFQLSTLLGTSDGLSPTSRAR